MLITDVKAAAIDREPASRELVGSLKRGLGVMEVLAGHPGGLTLTETAERAGLDRAGARRFLLTLVAAGYAVQEGRRFSLSPRLLWVARTWLQGASLWGHAEPFMRKVAAELNESCSAAVLSGEDVVYVMGHGAPQKRPVRIDRRNADRAVIRSGVTAGERVALKDPTLEVARR